MKISVYTSCSLNYLPKARVLAESLANAEPQASLTLCLNDATPDWLDPVAEPFDRIWLPEDRGYDRGWVFQHNLMELCTAVKGRALLRLIEQDEGPAPGSPPSSALAPATACSRVPTRRF